MCNLLTKLDNEAKKKLKPSAKIEHRHISVYLFCAVSVSLAHCCADAAVVVQHTMHTLHAICLRVRARENSDTLWNNMHDWRNKLYFKSTLQTISLAFSTAHSRKHGTFSKRRRTFSQTRTHTHSYRIGYTIRALTVVYQCAWAECETRFSFNRTNETLREREIIKWASNK